jgi:hypothetical protein
VRDAAGDRADRLQLLPLLKDLLDTPLFCYVGCDTGDANGRAVNGMVDAALDR